MPEDCLRLLKQTAVLLLSSLLSGTAASAGLYDYGSFDLRGLPEIGTAGETALSVGKEIRLGKFFSRQARRMLPVTDDPVIDEYLASVGQKLIAASDGVRFPFHFFLEAIDFLRQLNAAAFLGGSVKVNSGLFHYAENESELAGVLAHEVSHITRRHLAQFIEASSRSNKLTFAGIAGAIALSMLNPALGAAALTTARVNRRKWAKSGNADVISGIPLCCSGRSCRKQWIMFSALTVIASVPKLSVPPGWLFSTL